MTDQTDFSNKQENLWQVTHYKVIIVGSYDFGNPIFQKVLQN